MTSGALQPVGDAANPIFGNSSSIHTSLHPDNAEQAPR